MLNVVNIAGIFILIIQTVSSPYLHCINSAELRKEFMDLLQLSSNIVTSVVYSCAETIYSIPSLAGRAGMEIITNIVTSELSCNRSMNSFLNSAEFIQCKYGDETVCIIRMVYSCAETEARSVFAAPEGEPE